MSDHSTPMQKKHVPYVARPSHVTHRSRRTAGADPHAHGQQVHGDRKLAPKIPVTGSEGHRRH